MTPVLFGRPMRSSLPLVCMVAVAWAGAPAQHRLKLTPERIEMGSFYSGARLRVGGTLRPGSQAIVVVRGAARRESFNQKGRFGPIWLNAGGVRISGAPSLFLCFSSKPVGSLLDSEVIRERLLDEASIQAHVEVEPRQNPGRAANIRKDFLALKKQDGLYQIFPEGLKLGAPDAGSVPFSAEFLWPKIAPPSSYTVMLLECRDRAVIAESAIPLEVVKVGFPREFAVLATQHTAFYGVLAVLASACAGFAIDFAAAKLLGKRRRAAH